MAKIQSNMVELGSKAPLFQLIDVVSGELFQLPESNPPIATVIMFICNHCPYVKHIITKLIHVASDYKANGVAFIAISSNDIKSYPADSPENMKLLAKQYSYPFPYLFDATQEVAIAYQAACTPDFFVYDKELKLVYRGQFDDSRPGNNMPVDGHSLCTTLDCILTNQPTSHQQLPSLGCSIKWKDSNYNK